MKNNEQYWDERITREINSEKLSDREVQKKLDRIFKKVFRNVEKDISVLFQRYAEDNKLSYREAMQYLTGEEFKEWRMDLKSYIKEIEKTNNPELLLELNTLAMKSRISRLEEIKYQVDKDLNTCYTYSNELTKEILTKSVVKSYSDVTKILANRYSIKPNVISSRQKLLEILKIPWSGENYSGRIWGNRQKTAGIVKDELVKGIVNGSSSEKIVRNVASKMEGSKKDIMRVVITERSYVQNEAKAQAFKDAGFEYYKFKAETKQENT